MSVLEINGKDELKQSLINACESILREEDAAIIDLITMFGLATAQAELGLDEETANIIGAAGVSVIERLGLAKEYMQVVEHYGVKEELH